MFVLMISLTASACTISSDGFRTVEVRDGMKKIVLEDPWTDENLLDYFIKTTARLELNRAHHQDTIDQALVVIDASFDATVGISLTRDIIDEEYHKFESYDLTVAIIEGSDRSHEDFGDVRQFTTIVRRYHVDATPAEVSAIESKLSSSNFYLQKLSDRSGRGCADGTVYFIEAKFGKNRNLVARHSCHDNYVETFQAANAIIELARARIPMLNARLATVQSGVLDEARSTPASPR